jgi:hypothetical protein
MTAHVRVLGDGTWDVLGPVSEVIQRAVCVSFYAREPRADLRPMSQGLKCRYNGAMVMCPLDSC